MVIRLRIEIDDEDRKAIAFAHSVQQCGKASYQKCKSIFLGAIDGELDYCFNEISLAEERIRDREEE